MKTKIILALAVIGLFGMSHVQAGERRWVVTVTSGTHQTIFHSYGYLGSITMSSGTTTSNGDYLIGFSSAPSAGAGANNTLMANDLFTATATVIPAMVFQTTTSVVAGTSLNNYWKAPTDDGVFVDSDLVIRQSAAKSGGANTAMIIWSK